MKQKFQRAGYLRNQKVKLGFRIMEQERNLKCLRRKLNTIEQELKSKDRQALSEKICHQVDEILEKEEPCKFYKNGSCIGYRMSGDTEFKNCCKSCRYLGVKGCTIKCMGCKFWLCLAAENNLSAEAKEKIQIIKNEAYDNGFTGIIGMRFV